MSWVDHCGGRDLGGEHSSSIWDQAPVAFIISGEGPVGPSPEPSPSALSCVHVGDPQLWEAAFLLA